MGKGGYLILTTGVIGLGHRKTRTGYMLNGFEFLSAFSAHIVSDIRIIQNILLVIIVTNHVIVGGCLNPVICGTISTAFSRAFDTI
jgi:hypothetical protein